MNYSRLGLALIFMTMLASYAQAQNPPDAGSLLRDTEKSLEQDRLPATVPAPPAHPATEHDKSQVKVTVKAFRLKGVGLIPEQDILSALAPWVGQSVTFSGLQQAADAVTELYRARGFLVRSYLPEQDLTDGVVTIVVIEGKLGAVRIDRIDGATHIGEEKARDYMLARHQMDAPVRPDDLQRAITLLNELPGISASSVLEPGEHEGESKVVVSIRDTPMLAGHLQTDNSGNKSTGEYRLTGGVNINSPLGIGDQIQALGNVSEHAAYGRLAYSLPLGADGLRMGADFSRLPYRYTLSGTTYSGNARILGFNANYPIFRSNTKNLSVVFTLDRKDFNNSVQGIELNNKRIDIASMSLSGDSLDGFLGGGLIQYAISYTAGRLDLSGNASDLAADQIANGPDRNGHFGKLNWNLARLQRIGKNDSLAIIGSGQWAGRNLDTAEKFLATGPFGVRAYSTSEASGDNGVMMNVEWRHLFTEILTGLAFFDIAHIQRDKTVNSATLSPNSGNYSGAGIGVSYGKASDLLLRVSLAWRIGTNPFRNQATGQDADGTHRNPRVWISLLKTF